MQISPVCALCRLFVVIQRDMTEAGVFDALRRYTKREEAMHCW